MSCACFSSWAVAAVYYQKVPVLSMTRRMFLSLCVLGIRLSFAITLVCLFRYDAVCLFVNDAADGEILKTLAKCGVGMVALR